MKDKDKIKKQLRKAIADRDIESVLWQYVALATEEVMEGGIQARVFKPSDLTNMLHNIMQIEKSQAKLAVETGTTASKKTQKDLKKWMDKEKKTL